MGFEDDLGWEYFENDPDHSPRMKEHMDWHMASENMAQTGNYGERFITFHRQYIAKFEQFRKTKGLLPVSPWDPATPISPALVHTHTLTAPRDTDNPSVVNPLCKTPTWATVAGGATPDPLWGHTSLGQFASLDELGKSLDAGWHGTVHNTIGGDMSQFHSPIDPVFWRWHKWVDGIARSWESWRLVHVIPKNIAAVVQILFGVTNDAPGIVIGPDGQPRHVPGGPGDPEPWLPVAVKDMLLGLLLRDISAITHHGETKEALAVLGAKLTHGAQR